jgi:hypothetical protein
MMKDHLPLPNELLNQIISYLPDHDDREDHFDSMESAMQGDGVFGARCRDEKYLPTANLKTLTNLCLVSKAMFAVARRHLYTQFIFGPPETPNLRKFLINILKDPYLAQQLRYISFEFYVHCGARCRMSTREYKEYLQEYSEFEDYQPDLEPIILRRALVISNLSFKPQAEDEIEIPFVEHLTRRCLAAHFILLLCYTPNLEVLTLGLDDPVDGWSAYFIYPMIQRLGSVSSLLPTFSPPLAKLRKLVLEGSNTEDDIWFDLSQWAAVAKLPSLRTLHTYGSRNSFGVDKAILSVQELHLINTSQVSSSDIYNIFESCVALREVKVNHSMFRLTANPDEYQSTYECLQHLQHCKQSLENLDWPHEIHFRRMLLELALFTNLRKVCVAICSFLDDNDTSSNSEDEAVDGGASVGDCDEMRSEDLVNCFPESIEHITVYRCYQSADSSHSYAVHGRSKAINEHILMSFASAIPARLTNLKTVTYCYGYHMVAEEWVTKLSDSYSAVGVRFVLEKGYFW